MVFGCSVMARLVFILLASQLIEPDQPPKARMLLEVFPGWNGFSRYSLRALFASLLNIYAPLLRSFALFCSFFALFRTALLLFPSWNGNFKSLIRGVCNIYVYMYQPSSGNINMISFW